MSLNLPYGINGAVRHHQVDEFLFVAGWIRWCQWYGSRFSDDPARAWSAQVMPVLGVQESLRAALGRGDSYVWSLDILCRILSSSRNTMYAQRRDFYPQNRRLLVPRNCVNTRSNRNVAGFQLTDIITSEWGNLTESQRERWFRAFDAVIEALGEDVDIIGGCAPETLTDVAVAEAVPPVIESTTSTQTASTEAALIRTQLLRRLVSDIQSQPHTPSVRRKRLLDRTATGWDGRLLQYFWPSPQYDLACNHELARGFHETAQQILPSVIRQMPWPPQEQQAAMEWANAIFEWGGVSQNNVTHQDIRSVIESALRNDANANAPMNSGWTKIAAFATMAAGPTYHQMVIWDSRVATAITSRLDVLLFHEGIQDPRGVFPGIGTVPGRGGTRPRPLSLRWPSGYRRWSSQVAASELVNDICAILNTETDPHTGTPYPRMPTPEGARTAWDVRGVEMVLFMDGY